MKRRNSCQLDVPSASPSPPPPLMHAFKQHRLSHNSSPVCSSFVLIIASDMDLEPESEKRKKNADFHTAKKCLDTSNTFPLFLDEFLIPGTLTYLLSEYLHSPLEFFFCFVF